MTDWFELGRAGVPWAVDDEPVSEVERLVKALPLGSPEIGAWFAGVQAGHAERRGQNYRTTTPGSMLPAESKKRS